MAESGWRHVSELRILRQVEVAATFWRDLTNAVSGELRGPSLAERIHRSWLKEGVIKGCCLGLLRSI
jgi:hypothetical protein